MQTKQGSVLAWGSRRSRWLSGGLAVLVMAAGMAPAAAHEADGNPARIHAGSCEQLGAVAFPLNGVGAGVDLDDAPIATPTTVNPDSSATVVVSETTIDAPLTDILGGEHAVMIYESDEEMTGIACGNVGGAMLGDQLVAGLAEIGVAGHSGFALFQPEGDQTAVTILLGHDLAPVSAAGGGEAASDDAEEGDHEDAAPHDEGAGTPAPDATPDA